MKQNLQAISFCMFVTFFHVNAKSQNIYIPSDSTATNILKYTFSGGSFESYGCDNLDPTFWLSENGDTVLIEFVNPQKNPSIRVWGMNDDDTAKVMVNSSFYPLSSTTASYEEKKICNNIFGSPGPDGVLFSSGLLVGANSNYVGNFSYQDVMLLNPDVKSIHIIGLSGDGWGFAGTIISDSVLSTSIKQDPFESINIFPNPADDILNIALGKLDYPVDIEVINLLGIPILSNENCKSERIAINISALTKGTYFISFKMRNASITRMFNH